MMIRITKYFRFEQTTELELG